MINKLAEKNLLGIQLVFGLIWFKSAIPKFLEPLFVNNLASTLTYFASKNPLPWYRQFLQTTAIPNVSLFAELTRFGELTAAILLSVTAILALRKMRMSKLHELAIIGAIIGAWLNLQFGLASFWTSPASETLNLLMFLVQGIFVFYHWQTMKN